MIRFFKNVLIAVIVSVILFFAVDYGIQVYTKHGVTVKVPNIVGQSQTEAIMALQSANLVPVIQDSVYEDSFPKMAITDQDPDSTRTVKEGRKIYLTINSLPKPKVRMPKLVDKSLNLGKAILTNTGLQLGKLSHQYSLLGSGFIIQQYFEGDSIPAGKMVEKGSAIDLKVSKYISVDSVYFLGVDTSKVIGWEFKEGYMNEEARKQEAQMQKAADSTANMNNEG